MKLRTWIVAAAFFGLPFVAALSAGATEKDDVATVTGPWITLGDVAQASGPLAKVRVAPSPAPGETLALDPDYVARIAREHGVYFPDSRTSPIHVVRSTVKSEKPKAAKKALPDRPSDAHFLVLTRDVARGDKIGAFDMAWAGPEDGVRPSRGAPDTMAELVGMEAKRSLRANRALRNTDFKPPSVIRKGEPVTLVYAKGGLMLTVGGRALEDAAQGEPVRIMNNYSNRSIDAVASGAGEARVVQF